MTVLQGQLDEGVLANLLMYLSQRRSSGALGVRNSQGDRGIVYLESGRVVHVASGGESGVLALARMLAWNEGRFAFRPDLRTSERSVETSLEALLREASRPPQGPVREAPPQLDPHTVLRPVDPQGERGVVALTLRAVNLLRDLDGSRDLDAIARSTDTPLANVLEAAQELQARGLAAPVDPETIDPAFVRELSREVVQIMGPMGEIVVEDALYDLGLDAEALPRNAVGPLLDELAAQFRRPDWRQQFRVRAESLRQRYDRRR